MAPFEEHRRLLLLKQGDKRPEATCNVKIHVSLIHSDDLRHLTYNLACAAALSKHSDTFRTERMTRRMELDLPLAKAAELFKQSLVPRAGCSDFRHCSRPHFHIERTSKTAEKLWATALHNRCNATPLDEAHLLNRAADDEKCRASSTVRMMLGSLASAHQQTHRRHPRSVCRIGRR